MNFAIFDVVLLILAIIVVGNFLRDGKSNYLEGALLILIYIIVAGMKRPPCSIFINSPFKSVSAWHYPNPEKADKPGEAPTGSSNSTGEDGGVAERAIRMFLKV